MKLAKRAYLVSLVLLALVFAANAQNRNGRPENDPRNSAPTIGTGGPVGGATGLFTVYDGWTLQKGEYTLSFALSNYDRDPGDVDITSVPVSFQVGLTNNFELFFSTEAYRGIKVNSPRNLSSFYLPNSQVSNGAGGWITPPAIVLAPQGSGVSLYGNRAIFRPAGAPFVQFPYIGGNAGTYGLTPPFYSGPLFGFAANTNATLGPSNGAGASSNYPGIGSVYGSILPGVVLETGSLTGVAGSPATTLRGNYPTIFTLAPSYLPDAPFVNRTWGTSSFNSLTGGFKWRWTGANKPVGFGMMAAYTWYMDNADDFSGFNQMQRGSGPGGNRGDIFVGFFADARVAKWANVSANVAYNWTSKVESDLAGGTLLDRPDELQSSLGIDFPVNKFFQPIVEFRSLKYVGGRTPNAFENSPIEGLAGARIFFRRWVGMSLGYRYHINQQDVDSFGNSLRASSVVVPCITTQTACTPTTVVTSYQGIPRGFRESTNPNGYLFQFFVGRRNERLKEIENKFPVINSVTVSDTTITLPCPPGMRSESCSDKSMVDVATSASDPENDPLVYNYTVSGGRVVGSGANVQWDLSGVSPGTYTVTVGVQDGCGACVQPQTRTVEVKNCADCVQPCSCPTLTVTGPSSTTEPGQAMTFTANVSGGPSVTYNWSVSAGTIESGQGTSTITVNTTSDMAGQNVTATVEIGGLPTGCNCQTTASDTAGIANKPTPNMIDEYGKLKDDDVKARIDNYYIQLNNDPTAQGVIVVYGTPAQIKAQRAQIMKAINFRKYDASRVTIVNGDGEGPYVKLWIVPAGADQPPTTR